jgi:hypothetical protein
MRRTRLLLSAALAVLIPIRVAAQERPAPTADLSAGWAAFADDSWIHHRTAAAAVRFHVTPRFSVGPEVTYMIGPDTDRDLFVSGNAVYEWPTLIQDGLPRVVPYVIGGWGYFRHRSQFGPLIWHGTAYAGGPGLRVRVSDRIFVAPELRFGSELDVRFIGVVSWRLRPS